MDVASAAVAPAGCSAIAGDKPDCVTSTGSVMYVVGSTLTGAPEVGISQSWTVLEVTVVAAIRSDVCARIIPVVENPSSAANPAAAALEHTPAFSVPPARVHAASGVSLPVDGSRRRSTGSGTTPRPGSTSTTVEVTGATVKAVSAASSSCGKTWFTVAKTPPGVL